MTRLSATASLFLAALALLVLAAASPPTDGSVNASPANASPVAPTDTAQTATLQVSIEGIRSADGVILLRVFDDGDGFPRDGERAVKTATAPIEEGTATATLEDLPAGRYAVVAIHDADDDGEIDTNWIGLPQEGIGSPGYDGGRPSFDDLAFDLSAGVQRSTRIELHYR